MREAQVPGTLQVSVSSISNLNKEGVRFLIISLSDLEFHTQYLLESTVVACYAYHSGQTSGVYDMYGVCGCVVCVVCVGVWYVGVWVCGHVWGVHVMVEMCEVFVTAQLWCWCDITL